MDGPPALDRRGFLVRGMWFLAAWTLWPRAAAAAWAGGIRGWIRAPGHQVRWEGRGASAWFVHRWNGQERSRRLVNARPGGVVLAGLPMEGGLPPGEHEFLLEVRGRRIPCGGFRVTPFRFGC